MNQMNWANHPTSAPIPPRRISSVGDYQYQYENSKSHALRTRLNSTDNPRKFNNSNTTYLAPLPSNIQHEQAARTQRAYTFTSLGDQYQGQHLPATGPQGPLSVHNLNNHNNNNNYNNNNPNNQNSNSKFLNGTIYPDHTQTRYNTKTVQNIQKTSPKNFPQGQNDNKLPGSYSHSHNENNPSGFVNGYSHNNHNSNNINSTSYQRTSPRAVGAVVGGVGVGPGPQSRIPPQPQPLNLASQASQVQVGQGGASQVQCGQLGQQPSLPSAFSQYYNTHPIPNYVYPTPIAGIEGCIEKLAHEGERLGNSIKNEAFIFQNMAKQGMKLDNYFNGLSNSGGNIMFEANKLQSIQRQQMAQIRDVFVKALRAKLTTPAEVQARCRQIEMKIKELEKAIFEKQKSLQKPKLPPLKKSQIKAELDKYQSEVNNWRLRYKNPPRIESRNEILGTAVRYILYPASYDYILRLAKYSKIWEGEMDRHKNSLVAIGSSYQNFLNSNPTSSTSRHSRHNSLPQTSQISSYFSNTAVPSKLPKPMISCCQRVEFKKEIGSCIKEMEKLEIVDKPD